MEKDDYLFAKKAIVQQIKDNCKYFKRVIGVAGFSEAKIKALATPAALIAYKGDTPEVSEDSRGISEDGQFVTQQYVVLVVVRNQDTYEDADAELEDETGKLLQDVIDALQGFQVAESHDELFRRPGMAPIYSGEYAYYPITYETRFWSEARQAQ